MIDEKALKYAIANIMPSRTEVFAIIDIMPDAIVRCKDCVYWQDNNDGYPHIGCKWREDETPDPDDFCSAGERMEGRKNDEG